MKEKCIVFGAGGYGRTAYELLEEKYDIIGFCDNNEKKWGDTFLDKPVVAPDSLGSMKNILIVIASQWYAAIGCQLREMGIKNIRVFWYKANMEAIFDDSYYILSELPETKLFEKCETDWNKIKKIKTDFSKNYSDKTYVQDVSLDNNSKLKKVLFCAYWFPPIGGVGVQRSLKFVKYLRHYGYEPVVLTCMPDNCWQFAMDESLLKEIEEDITVIRINNDVYLPEIISEKEQQEIFNLYAGVVESEDWLNQLKKIQGQLVYPLLSLNTSICWVNRCLKYLESKMDLDEIDFIYTTGDPFETFILGYYIKNKYGIPWIQDYRDPWCTNKYFTENIYHSLWTQTLYLQEKLEEKLIKNSDRIVLAADFTDEFIEKYSIDKSKFVEINNGYDEEDFKDISVKIGQNEKFTLCYNGHVYKTTNPIPLLCTINKMIEQKKIEKDKVQWIFNGIVENEWKQHIDKEDKYKIIQYNGHLEHKMALEVSMNSDALVLFGGVGEGAKIVYTGKVFEYLRMKKPIFCFSSRDGVLDKLLLKTQTGKCFEYDDLKNTEKYLVDLYEKWKKGEVVTGFKEKEIEKYSRENETMRLAEVFHNISGK